MLLFVLLSSICKAAFRNRFLSFTNICCIKLGLLLLSHREVGEVGGENNWIFFSSFESERSQKKDDEDVCSDRTSMGKDVQEGSSRKRIL